MEIFLTGASGFIGSSVGARLLAAGHRLRGLVRDPAKAEAVRAIGIEPVVGTLDDAALLAREARAVDAVVNAASSDHREAVEALPSALAGSGKALVHTSGSSVVADEAMGEPSDRVFDEETEFAPAPDKAARVALDRRVLGAPASGAASYSSRISRAAAQRPPPAPCGPDGASRTPSAARPASDGQPQSPPHGARRFPRRSVPCRRPSDLFRRRPGLVRTSIRRYPTPFASSLTPSMTSARSPSLQADPAHSRSAPEDGPFRRTYT